MTHHNDYTDWPVRVLPDTKPVWIPPLPKLEDIQETTIEVRQSTQKEISFSFIFIAGNQGRIVEADDSINDNFGGFEIFMQQLIADEPLAYIAVDRLSSIDHILARKIAPNKILLQIYEIDEDLSVKKTGIKPLMFLEAIVGYRKLVWEIYTAYCGIRITPQRLEPDFESIRRDQINWHCLPDIHDWLGLQYDRDYYHYPDDIFGDDALDRPWTR